jgi:hypothetical protein
MLPALEGIMKEQLQGKTTAVLNTPNAAVTLHIDLQRLNMTDRQRAIVQKLFALNPIAEVAEAGHSHAAERGKDGPASKYLTREEFDSVRELGVRLGTSGVLAHAQCDFCLHCVSLEAKPDLGRAVE